MTPLSENSIVAAFDFDHTLIDRDSLISFLFYTQGKRKASYHLALLIPAFIRYLLGQISRKEIKEKLIGRFFKGRSFFELERLGKAYADEKLDCFLKPEALRRLEWHQSRGHRCLLVSASFEFYLDPWAKRRGFEKVIGSRLEVDADGSVTGKMLGENCRGPEKKYRLLSYLGPKENYTLYAYGDSDGDREMLELADYPFYRRFT